MENNENLYKNLGDIVLGPSREMLFDSLKLGILVGVNLVSQSGKIISQEKVETFVLSITFPDGFNSKIHKHRFSYSIYNNSGKCSQDWVIVLGIRISDSTELERWEGEYSTELMKGPVKKMSFGLIKYLSEH